MALRGVHGTQCVLGVCVAESCVHGTQCVLGVSS